MPTRQNSSSGRPKSPRIQVVLPEELCARLSLLAERETRTVSNMAKVLIQQGVERREAELEQVAPAVLPIALAPEPGASQATAPPAPAGQVAAPQPGPIEGPALGQPPAPPPAAAATAAADRFRAELERNEAQQPRRLRGLPRRLRLRPPAG